MNTIFNQKSIEEAESIVCSGLDNIQVKVASANLPEHNKKNLFKNSAQKFKLWVYTKYLIFNPLKSLIARSCPPAPTQL